jgi:hypothetical protein
VSLCAVGARRDGGGLAEMGGNICDSSPFVEVAENRECARLEKKIFRLSFAVGRCGIDMCWVLKRMLS